LVDSDGEGWFKQNLKQMRNFTEQQVHDIVNKANLQSQQERIKQVVSRGTQKGVDPRPDRPRDNPQIFDFTDTDLDERMRQQQDIIDTRSDINARQIQERENRVAPRFREALGAGYSAWPTILTDRRDRIGAASSSGTTTVPPTMGGASSSGATMAIPESIAETPVKRRVGRPSKADIRARGEQALKAITEARARDMAVTEARDRAARALTYDSATDNPFSTDDEGMKGSTITKRATSDEETPQKGVGLKNEEHVGSEQSCC
jgi:hypothetical protein